MSLAGVVISIYEGVWKTACVVHCESNVDDVESNVDDVIDRL